jgi:DNA-binding MarR family transcriptional regulator
MPKQEEKLLSVIFNVGRLIKEEMRASACLVDFTQTEIETIKFVQDKKTTTMRPIADYLHIKPSSVTPLIDKLVKSGHLRRITGEVDRRALYIGLTAKGLKDLQKKYKTIHKSIGKIFGKLSANDKKNLINIFQKIHAENT